MKHGGDLGDAAELFRGDGRAWLDLSTGISPLAYPFAPPDAQAWQQLPQSRALEALLSAARRAYGAPDNAPIVAAPGTQMLIQLLPLLFPQSRVAIVGPAYSEHAQCWRRAGADVSVIGDLDCPPNAKIVVLVNPNNPDGRSWGVERVLACADAMAEHGGLLIVDEAFADVAPEVSVTAYAGQGGLLILRSFGKFFGLAGVRLGFALGPGEIIARFEKLLGPWAVSGFALAIGMQALRDIDWRRKARATYRELSARLDDVLVEAGLDVIGGTTLFRLVSHPQASAIHTYLAEQAIWVRRFDDAPQWLRFGLPRGEVEFARLGRGLKQATQNLALTPR